MIQSQLEITSKLLKTPLPHLSSTEKFLLSVLSTYANTKRDRGKLTCWPTGEALQELLGVSEPTLRRALSRLEDLGLIERDTKYDAAANKRRRVITLHLEGICNNAPKPDNAYKPAPVDDGWGDPEEDDDDEW